MQIEELLKHVADEPERTVTQTVWTTPPELLAKASKPGGLMMTEFLAAPGRRAEQRNVRYRHILGAPASQQAIETWLRERPSHRLPPDLLELVLRVNGIHLWARTDTGRSYAGIAPIEEWEIARIKLYGATANPGLLDEKSVAISYHQDAAAFVVLDVTTGKYLLMDAAGPDATSPIANNAGELLDWLWRSRITPKA